MVAFNNLKQKQSETGYELERVWLVNLINPVIYLYICIHIHSNDIDIIIKKSYFLKKTSTSKILKSQEM